MKNRLKRLAAWADENSEPLTKIFLGTSVAYLAYTGMKQQKINRGLARATLTLIDQTVGEEKFNQAYYDRWEHR